ncbi:MAG: hypothetical protein Q7J34_12465 [Bacteroidales bacterium]|jgi:hypothetical protein|nr:hypothetical protein [Bacteroidales bacterium]
MKYNPFKLICLVMLMFSLAACEYEWIEAEPIPPLPPEEVSFQNEIMPYFDASCNMAGCHATGGFSPDLSAANAYNVLTTKGWIDTTTPANSKIYKAVTSGSMKTFSTATNSAILLKWIKEGAKNN